MLVKEILTRPKGGYGSRVKLVIWLVRNNKHIPIPEICTNCFSLLSKILFDANQNAIPNTIALITIVVISNNEKNLRNDTGLIICRPMRTSDNQY